MHLRIAGMLGVMAVATLASAKEGQEPKKPAMDTKEMMAAMEKMGALNENHRLLQFMVGTWDYHTKLWMDPSAPAQESSGVCVTKPVMGGRYYHSDLTGPFTMPGPDGKPVTRDFEGKALNGYDNMKGKFFAAWIDNMSTGILVFDGNYDAVAKTFTYGGEMACPLTPSGKMGIREVVKIISPDQYLFEWYETRDGKEMKSMEITYTRRKS